MLSCGWRVGEEYHSLCILFFSANQCLYTGLVSIRIHTRTLGNSPDRFGQDSTTRIRCDTPGSGAIQGCRILESKSENVAAAHIDDDVSRTNGCEMPGAEETCAKSRKLRTIHRGQRDNPPQKTTSLSSIISYKGG